MKYTLSKESASIFESIKHINEDGIEYWSARELAPYLGYSQWRNFETVIIKAKEACKSATGSTENDFADVSKIVKAGAAEKPLSDYYLTRYACYLVAQNGDSRKSEIAEAQTYEVGRKVRETIAELGGTMPEDLPSVESIKEVEKNQKKLAAQSAPTLSKKLDISKK